MTRGRIASPASQAATLVALAALSFAALQITSGWSTPVYACLLLFLPGVLWLGRVRPGSPLRPRRSPWRPPAGGGRRAFGGPPRAPVLGAVLSPAPELGPRGGPVGPAVGLLQRVGVLPRAPRALRVRRVEDGVIPPGRTARTFLILAAVALPLSLVSFSLHPLRLPRPLPCASSRLSPFSSPSGRREARDEARLRPALALVAFGFAVLTGCELVFVWDRMNTIFKFHFETWLLFSLAGRSHGDASRLEEPRVARRDRPRRPGRAVHDRHGVRRLSAARPRGWPRFTLDGTAYLEGKTLPTAARSMDQRNVAACPSPGGAGAAVPGIHAPLHEHGPADGPGLGVPHAAARPQPGRDRAPQGGITAAYTSADEAVVKQILPGTTSRSSPSGTSSADVRRRESHAFESWTDLLTPVYGIRRSSSSR